MNTTIPFNRIVLLLERFFIEDRNRELLFWGILTLVFTLIHNADSVKLVLYISGFLFAARLFKVFSFTPGGMHYLLIPATHGEKLTTAILLSTVYFFGMTLLAYTIGSFTGTSITNMIFGTEIPVKWDLFYSTKDFIDVLSKFALIQAIFMLGSLYFKRNALGRTMFSIIAINILIVIIEGSLFKALFGTLSLSNEMFSMNNILSNTSIPSTIETVVRISTYILIPFLWVVSYFRLTEKQV